MSEEAIQLYLKQTGQPMKELMAGASAFGISKIIKIIKEEALPQKKKIEYFYKDDTAKNNDELSYRLV